MSTITVRALDPVTWEPQFGNGQKNFLSDLDAVAQIIATRLRLFQGEWFLDLLDGLPLFQSILGSSGSNKNLQVVTNILAQRINGSPFVTGITSIEASYVNRVFSFTAYVTTLFGTLKISSAPGSSATLTNSIT